MATAIMTDYTPADATLPAKTAGQPFYSLDGMQQIADRLTRDDCNLRVVTNPQLPVELQLTTEIWGLAGEMVTGAIRSWGRERWQDAGDHEFIVINSNEIADCARQEARRGQGKSQKHIEQRLLVSVLLHEIAHVHERPPTPSIDPQPQQQQRPSFDERGLAKLLANDDTEWINPHCPYVVHGRRFIRSLVHVVYRFRRHFRLAPVQPYHDILLDFQCYKVSPLAAYTDAIGDEPYRLRDQPFSAIRSTKPPESFQKLFQADASHWLKHNDHQFTTSKEEI